MKNSLDNFNSRKFPLTCSDSLTLLSIIYDLKNKQKNKKEIEEIKSVGSIGQLSSHGTQV